MRVEKVVSVPESISKCLLAQNQAAQGMRNQLIALADSKKFSCYHLNLTDDVLAGKEDKMAVRGSEQNIDEICDQISSLLSTMVYFI